MARTLNGENPGKGKKMFNRTKAWCNSYNTEFYARQAARKEKAATRKAEKAAAHAAWVNLSTPSAPSAPEKKNFILPSAASVTPFYQDIMRNATHLLVAGETGSGKSVVLNGLLHTALAMYTPDDMGLILVDPKIVELSPYKTLPHVLHYETEPEDVLHTLREVYSMMMERYNEMDAKHIRKYDGAKLVIVIDELADLFLSDCGNEIKKELVKILQKGRAANIMVICATQAPSRKILSAELVLNITNRIALHCANAIESKQIVNEKGAENLPAHGSCLYKSPNESVRRVDGIPFFTDDELDERIEYWTAA